MNQDDMIRVQDGYIARSQKLRSQYREAVRNMLIDETKILWSDVWRAINDRVWYPVIQSDSS